MMAGLMDIGRLVSKSRRACVVASTWSSWGAPGNCVSSAIYSRAHGQCSGCGSRTVPGLEDGVTGHGAAVLLPSGSTGMMPGTACFSASMTGRPLALSSTSLRVAPGPFGGKRPERGDRVRKPHTSPDLIEE